MVSFRPRVVLFSTGSLLSFLTDLKLEYLMVRVKPLVRPASCKALTIFFGIANVISVKLCIVGPHAIFLDLDLILGLVTVSKIKSCIFQYVLAWSISDLVCFVFTHLGCVQTKVIRTNWIYNLWFKGGDGHIICLDKNRDICFWFSEVESQCCPSR